MEWRLSRRPKHLSGMVDDPDPNGAGRYKRDVHETTKYIETAIIVDRAMFDKRNGSTRAEVVHDAIQVANIADLVCISLCVLFDWIGSADKFAYSLLIKFLKK